MKCQDGGREIACITYPQGALVVFPRISHTRGEYSKAGHTLKEKVGLSSTHNLPFFCPYVKMNRFLTANDATTASKGHRHEKI